MKISIFGLGYVGCVIAACMAKNGHHVIGVDIDAAKVNLINHGKPTIVEKDLAELVLEGHNSGRLKSTTSVEDAILDSCLSIICVGTPSTEDGSLNLVYLQQVAMEIGRGLALKSEFHVILIRSTVPPGTHDALGHLIAEHSGKSFNQDFAMVSNPEFLREGTAVKDYFNPPYTLIGSEHPKALEMAASLYTGIDAPLYKTELKVAEVIKYASNAFHALKVTFANEVGNICKAMSIDSHAVMEVFCKDTKLNISPYYLKPGLPYGGSCLPKDLCALVNLASRLNIEVPVLKAIQPSNVLQRERIVREVVKTNCKRIGIIGLAFKAGTDDLRDSPMVEVAECLIGKGYQVNIYDKNLFLSKLNGINKSFIETKLPHLSTLLTSMECLVQNSDLLIIATQDFDYQLIVSDGERASLELSKCRKKPIYVGDKVIFDVVRLENYQQYVCVLNTKPDYLYAGANGRDTGEYLMGNRIAQTAKEYAGANVLFQYPVEDLKCSFSIKKNVEKGHYVGLCW